MTGTAKVNRIGGRQVSRVDDLHGALLHARFHYGDVKRSWTVTTFTSYARDCLVGSEAIVNHASRAVTAETTSRLRLSQTPSGRLLQSPGDPLSLVGRRVEGLGLGKKTETGFVEGSISFEQQTLANFSTSESPSQAVRDRVSAIGH